MGAKLKDASGKGVLIAGVLQWGFSIEDGFMTQAPVHILALDSATQVCDVALLSVEDGRRQVWSARHEGSSEHAETVLPMMERLLAQAGLSKGQLSALAFGQGPGAFTGLRVACGVVQGAAYALGIPVVPVVSLHAMAQAGSGSAAVRVVVQDARMGELYVAAYAAPLSAAQAWQTLHEPVLLSVADLGIWLSHQAEAWPAGEVCLLGNAHEAYPELAAVSVPQRQLTWQALEGAQAGSIAELAYLGWMQGNRGVPPSQAAPLYVREKVAFTTAERAQGQGGNPRAMAVHDIQRLQVSDLDAVAEIERRTQAHPWTARQFEEALQAGYEAWCIRESNQVLGYYLLMIAPDVAHLLLISVQPEQQRRGLGHAMLRHAQTRAATLELGGLLLEVRPSNRNALSFYKNRGFEQVGVRKGYYPDGPAGREDALVMKNLVHRRHTS